MSDVTPDTAAIQSVTEQSRSQCVRFSSRRVKGRIPLKYSLIAEVYKKVSCCSKAHDGQSCRP